MSFDINIKVKVDSTQATEDLNKLLAQLAKIYGTPAEMLDASRTIANPGQIPQKDNDEGRKPNSSGIFPGVNAGLTKRDIEGFGMLADTADIFFGGRAGQVLGLLSKISKLWDQHDNPLESIGPSTDLSHFDFLELQNLYDQAISHIQELLEEIRSEKVAHNEYYTRHDLRFGDRTDEIVQLETRLNEVQGIIANVTSEFEQRANAPFEALSGQIKIFAESFAAYKTESLGYLMSTADTVQELARLMNKRDASDGHDVKHTGGIIGEGGGGRLGSLYGIPRYHSGGLIGAREQLAILQHGEGVFTPGQMQNADHLIATLTGSLRRIEQELIQNLGSNPRDGFSLDLLSNAITEGLIRGLANGFLPGFLGQQAVASTNPQSPTQTHSNAEPGQQILQFGNEAQDMLQQVEGYTEDALLGMENALIQFVQTGKFEFKDLTNSILNDLLQISTREAITKPLTNALGNVFSGLFGGGGGGGGGGDPRSEHLFSSLAVRHTGGIAGESTVFRRKTFGDILNHYHSGGVIGGNEEVAVLQKGEGVFTPEQMSNADHLLAKTMKAQKQPAPVNLTVLIKNGDGPARKGKGEFRADGRGGGTTTIDMAEQLEGYLATRVARGYGPLAKVLRDQQRGRRWFRTVVVEGVKALQGGFTHGLAKLYAAFAKKLVS